MGRNADIVQNFNKLNREVKDLYAKVEALENANKPKAKAAPKAEEKAAPKAEVKKEEAKPAAEKKATSKPKK